MCQHLPTYSTLLCYISLLTGWTKYRHRFPNINDRDHLVGQLTTPDLLSVSVGDNYELPHLWGLGACLHRYIREMFYDSPPFLWSIIFWSICLLLVVHYCSSACCALFFFCLLCIIFVLLVVHYFCSPCCALFFFCWSIIGNLTSRKMTPVGLADCSLS